MNDLEHIVNVRDCRKDSINKRVDNTTLGMSLGRIKINKKNAPKLIEEFETII